MKINTALNLVISLVDDEDNIYAYVHSTPISYEVFEANYQLISRTYTEIMRNGADLMNVTGPKIASIVLADVAKGMAGAAGNAGLISAAFLAEVRRLSNVIMPKGDGWEPVPFQAALDRKMLQIEDVREVESVLIFFTSCWHLLPKKLRAGLATVVPVWGGQTSSSSIMDFIASLPTSKKVATIGAMAAE